MAKIIFQGYNNKYNQQFILDAAKRRILKSQNMYCEINNERGLIEFNVGESEVGPVYQAKTINMIMDDFVRHNCFNGLARHYFSHEDRLDDYVYAIIHNEEYEF